MKPRYFNAKYVYLLLAITFHGAYSSLKWSKPYLFFCICRGKKWRWSSCWSRKKKTKHLLRKHWILLGSFFHLSAQRTRGSSRTRTLYMELMEKPKSRSLSLDQCLPHLMCIQSPVGLGCGLGFHPLNRAPRWQQCTWSQFEQWLLIIHFSQIIYYSWKYNLLVQWHGHNQIIIEEDSACPRLCCWWWSFRSYLGGASWEWGLSQEESW